MTTTNNWRDEFQDKFGLMIDWSDGDLIKKEDLINFISLKIEEAKEEARLTIMKKATKMARNKDQVVGRNKDPEGTALFYVTIEQIASLPLSPTSDTK